MKVVVIDGQGGRMGRLVVEKLRAEQLPCEVVAVGTNAIATAEMLKAGADHAATGENAVIVNCRTADIIVGPIGIVIADSLYGEITPAMAVAVGQSTAQRVLLPMNLCRNIIVGVGEPSVSRLMEDALAQIRTIPGIS